MCPPQLSILKGDVLSWLITVRVLILIGLIYSLKAVLIVAQSRNNEGRLSGIQLSALDEALKKIAITATDLKGVCTGCGCITSVSDYHQPLGYYQLLHLLSFSKCSSPSNWIFFTELQLVWNRASS